MKNLLFILIFSLLATVSSASSGQELLNRSIVHGSVKSNDESLPFVTVYLKGTNIGTATDIKGNYVLSSKPGTYKIKVQGVGYKSLEKEITIDKNQTIELDFDLEQNVIMMDQVTVTGSRIGIMRYLPGSVSVVRQQEIRQQMPVSGNEVFCLLPGLHTVEEEGAGLRANIGIRGLDPDKSRNVLMLEDGIPVALGPYGEPEMYFTPAIERMMGVEVLKGNGQVLFGPQTIGGVINYITADPPAESSGYLSVKGGMGGYFNGHFNYGNTFGNAGFTTTYLRKQADHIGLTQFRLDDLSGKFRLQTGIRSTINIKWGVYNETSNSTYVGLTQAMYDIGDLDDLRIAPNDRLEVRRYNLSAAHDYHFNEKITLKTTAFAYTTTRNWLRQDFTYNPDASNLTGVWYGDETLPQGAIYLRNTTGNRNRQFEVAGLESRLRANYQAVGITNQLDAGARYLYERAFEQRINGTTAEALSGTLRDDEIRTGNAISLYAQNKTMLSEKLTLTGGLRMENLDYERKILRTTNKDTTIMNNTRLTHLIPGAGINFQASEAFGIYAGIHRGFAPPRIKDAISSTGEDVQLDAEKSWNYELGARLTGNGLIDAEIAVFMLDFSNQVIPVSESSGGAGSGLVNGGQTRHSGLELDIGLNISHMLPTTSEISLRANATLVESVFTNDRFVAYRTSLNGETEYINVKGNNTPYAPKLMLNSMLYYQSQAGFGGNFTISHTGKQFTDMLNTVNALEFIAIDVNDPAYTYVQATANGRIGEIPAYTVVHAGLWYHFANSGFEVSAAVKNLMNERYIVTRRPQGIRVGLPRTFIFGLSYSF